MAEHNPGSTFTSWKLSDQEILMGSVLSPQQVRIIQNDMAMTAEQILNLEFDSLNPVKFAQDDAHLKGQLSAYRFLLIRSEESESALRSLAQASANPET